MTAANMKYSLGLSVYQRLCREEKKNFVFSPLCMGMGFAMLSAGLKGDTKTELLNLFGTTDESALHAMYTKLLASDDLPVEMANKILTDQECVIQPQFESLLRTEYKSGVESVDFVRNAREIVQDVNAWVAGKTKNMIPELLTEDSLGKDTLLVLLNAIYFQGSWVKDFEPVPDLENFTLRGGEKVRRVFMRNTSERLEYGETDELRVVKIPYKEAGFRMIVAIPKDETRQIDEVIAGMQAADLVAAIESPRRGADVILTMPRFEIEYTFENLGNTLKDLGLRKIFTPVEGDFGNLFSKVKGNLPPYVHSIVHKAVIKVDEKGTTAAAAQPVRLRGGGYPKPPIYVEVNRPFSFWILSGDGIVAFAGICAEPRNAS